MWTLSLGSDCQTGLIKKCCSGRNETAIPASPTTHWRECLRYYTHAYIYVDTCIYFALSVCWWWAVVPDDLLKSCPTSLNSESLWIRGTKSWGTGMWAEGSLTSLVHIFLMVPHTSQVSLVWPWDDLEKSLFYSTAARWRARMWGWLARWRAGLAKPSRIIRRPDLGTVRHAAAPSYALPCGSDAMPRVLRTTL